MTVSEPPTTPAAAAARPETGRAAQPARRRHWRTAAWVAAVVFCVASVTATQVIDRFAPGSSQDARAMENALSQELGGAEITRIECRIADRVGAWSSGRIPATVTVREWGEPSDPRGKSIYTCTFVEEDDVWRVEGLKKMVTAASQSP